MKTCSSWNWGNILVNSSLVFLTGSWAAFSLESQSILSLLLLLSCTNHVSSNRRGVISKLYGTVFKSTDSGTSWPETWNPFLLRGYGKILNISVLQFLRLIIRSSNNAQLSAYFENAREIPRRVPVALWLSSLNSMKCSVSGLLQGSLAAWCSE